MIWSIVRFQKIGFHKYPDAPEEVSYLREKHRHIFFIEVWVEQKHNNRDIEYHILKKQCISEWDMLFRKEDMESASCEKMATDLWYDLAQDFNYERQLKVSVFEDNENGAMIDQPVWKKE